MELKHQIYSVGVQNPELEVFDIIMKTPRGTSYNAYLVKGREKTALIETAKEGFLEQYLKNIEAVVPFESVDYLIINHTEPDHAGIIPELLKRNSKLQLVGTSSAIAFIAQIINQPFNSRVVKKGDTLDLGGRELSFYPAPNLHWPDTMFTFDSLSKALFTCDFLGAHHAFAPLLMSKLEDKADYYKSAEKYFMDIMSPFAQPFVLNGIKQVRELDPSVVYPGHGVALDTGLEDMLKLYERLSAKPEKQDKSVAIVYVSAYGFTRKLAKTLEEEIKKSFPVTLIELNENNKAQAYEAIAEADGVLFGSPTFLGDTLQPIGELMAGLHPFSLKGKVCAAFGSYGWSGEAVGNMTERLNQLKAKTLEGVRARMRPSEEELALTRELAARMVDALK